MMEPSVENLIATANDQDLVIEICQCINKKRHRDDIPRSALPKEQQVVDLIMFAEGIIRNGGFMFFHELKGDCEATAKALELIEAHSAAEIMSIGCGDEEFWELNADMDQKLAAYIRFHKDAFDDLPPYEPDN